MHQEFKNILLEATGATDFYEIEEIQRLWSGYGQILRIGLVDSPLKTVVVKYVQLPQKKHHPRGWNTDISHNRKLKSYQIESEFYKNWSTKFENSPRIPKCFAVESIENEVLIVLEDLDAEGFPVRKSRVSWEEAVVCLKWLASFHATYLFENPKGLWEIGTYWHLDTRPDELSVMKDGELKQNAQIIDEILNTAKFQTFVHGDAKLANFCFSENSKQVVALDFQYIGGGCGIKDVAYFVGSCFYEEDLEDLETQILNSYFGFLKEALSFHDKASSFLELEIEWRKLYPVAMVDFHRFLEGWSPGHWKINSYTERLTKEVIHTIQK